MIDEPTFESEMDEDELDAQRKALDIRDAADIRWLMGDERGRRIMCDILEYAGVLRLSYTGEALSGAFNEGKRSSGNRLLTKILELCPIDFVAMLQEFKHDD